MADKTVYLVTGTNRGIGRAIVGLLLQRPNHTVIGTARKVSLPAARTIEDEVPVHPTSQLLTIWLDEDARAEDDETSATHGSDGLASSLDLVHRQMPHLGLDRIDVVIANAGTSSGFKDIASTDPDDLLFDFKANAIGPAKLFRALWPRLRLSPAEKDQRKFVLVTSSVASIGGLEQEHFPSTAYGMSKAAANWWAKKLSVEFQAQGLKVGIIHPGWVKTAMGQGLADAIGFPEPPMSAEDSATKLMEQIDTLTMEKSGKYLTYSGAELPW